MAEAAIERGLEYIAITDHSKALAMASGMNDERALAHAARIRAVSDELAAAFADKRGPQWHRYERLRSSGDASAQPPTIPFRLLAGVEVDILLDGTLDLTSDTLAQLDIVVASVHSGFSQPSEEITARVLRAAENPHVHILGHPTGRKVLGREPYKVDLSVILPAAAGLGVAVEHNASPARSDLNEVNLRLARQSGCKIVVNTDAHSIDDFDKLKFGIIQLRRAWLTAPDLLNTLPVDKLLAALKR